MSRKRRPWRNEAGIALLISIFILLLICVVAIALIVSSGTETALAGNYRSSTGVYYAANAGLEEGRSRLSPRDPNTLSTWSAFYPSGGNPLPIGRVGYLLNPGPGETAGAMLTTTYPDQEYDQEFGSGSWAAATVMTTNSIWQIGPLNTLSFPGPLYKWVRINAISEKSSGIDADGDGHADDTTHPLYYNGAQFTMTASGNSQVFEITALAVSPNGSGLNSEKLAQYLTAPGPIAIPPIQAALTLSGSPSNSPTFHAPASNKVYAVQGNDTLQGCSGSTGSSVAAIGLFGDYSGSSYSSDLSSITAGIPTSVGPSPNVDPQLNYTGLGPAPPVTNPPDVEYLTTYPTSLQTPAEVDAIAQNIIQNADAVFVPAGTNATQIAYLSSLGMSPTNIMTVVANGDLDISNWTGTGYGLLLVTGTFTYDPSATWNGIVLVIGQGTVNGNHLQNAQINGAVFVAKTRNGGSLVTGRIGGASVSFQDTMQGNGIRYSSCWVQKAQPMSAYRVLSFHEISQ